MKTIIIAGIGAVGLALASGAALAQEHSHGAHDHAAATSMPTMAECHSMHEQMMGESSDHHDEASRQTMMENMDEGMRTRRLILCVRRYDPSPLRACGRC